MVTDNEGLRVQITELEFNVPSDRWYASGWPLPLATKFKIKGEGPTIESAVTQVLQNAKRELEKEAKH